MAAGWISGLTEDPNDVIRSRPKAPTGYDSREDFLAEMRQRYEEGKAANQLNQDAGQEDAAFVAGDQWEDIVEQKRRSQRKPVLTNNRLVAFMAQIVGNRLMNETEIRVWPDKSGTKPAAELREGLIRAVCPRRGDEISGDRRPGRVLPAGRLRL